MRTHYSTLALCHLLSFQRIPSMVVVYVPSLFMLGHTRIDLSLSVDDYFEIVSAIHPLAILLSSPPLVSFDSELNLPE